MSWFALDDKSHGNPKVVTAGNAAWGLWCRCGAWSADHLTDGHIPAAIARLYGTRTEIAALVDASLWVPDGDGYVMPDYLDFNPGRDRVLEQRRQRSEAKQRAGRAGGIASGEARAKQKRSNREADSQAERQQNEAPIPNPIPSTYSDLDTHLPTECPAEEGTPPSTRSERHNQVAHAYAQMALERTTPKPSNPAAWYAATGRRIAADPELARLADLFPTAPPDAVAAWLHGDKGSQRYYPRLDEIPAEPDTDPCPVVPIRSETA